MAGEVVIVGKVSTGMGRGHKFMSKKGYKSQFIKKLGINPYHGTLNLKLSAAGLSALGKITRKKGILVEGFSSRGRAFGEVSCYMAEARGVKCALVVPKMSMHRDVAEIISSVRLRSRLGLKDGDRLKVSVRA